MSNKSTINILKDLNLLTIKVRFLNELKQLNNIIPIITKSISSYFSTKITFSGKGYKIRKFHKILNTGSNKFIMFYFNRSHLNIVHFFNTIVKKLKKSKILLHNSNHEYLQQLIKLVLNIRKLNVFTLKGLRLSRQLVYKKVGKKSS
jgi:ribosomal protein L6P/L9E